MKEIFEKLGQIEEGFGHFIDKMNPAHKALVELHAVCASLADELATLKREMAMARPDAPQSYHHKQDSAG